MRLDPSHSKFANEDMNILTESGYLVLVKSFTDDLAWKVQRQPARRGTHLDLKSKWAASPSKTYSPGIEINLPAGLWWFHIFRS